MPNALIYSAGLDGHRQTYVYVLAQLLESLGYQITVAGNLREKTSNTFYIDRLKANPAVTVLDTSSFSGGGLKISNAEFIDLQKKTGASLTVFAEADNHLELFNSQIGKRANRFIGKNIGIFLRPFYYYERTKFVNKLRYLRYLPKTWRTDSRVFHEWSLKKHRLLDRALCIDENFVSHHAYLDWLPDVFQDYAEQLVGETHIEERHWIGKLNAFKEKNKDLFIVLYFGTVQARRGYDELVKLAVEEGACFIHCGLNNDKVVSAETVKGKQQLEEKDRLFETNEYISDPDCIAAFFKSATHLALPYKDFYGSSGIMLQALSYGIPVLVPEKGIMGHRVKKHQLGMTYGEKNGELGKKFREFRKIPARQYQPAIKSYMKYQDPAVLQEVLINVLKDMPVKAARPE